MEKKTEMTFLEKVAAVQAELKAPKSQRNDFGKYNYRSCEDIFEAVKPLLAKYGLVLICSDDLVEIGGRNYVKATAELIDVKSGLPTKIFNTAYAREEETKKGMDGSQITGASSSYARKYALNGLFLIDDTRDSDATNTHGKEESKEEKPKEEKKAENKLSGKKASAKQIELIKTLVPEKDLPAMLKWAGVEKIEDMPIEAASKVITEKTKKKED